MKFQGTRRRTKGDLHKQLYKDHLIVSSYIYIHPVCTYVHMCKCAMKVAKYATYYSHVAELWDQEALLSPDFN